MRQVVQWFAEKRGGMRCKLSIPGSFAALLVTLSLCPWIVITTYSSVLAGEESHPDVWLSDSADSGDSAGGNALKSESALGEKLVNELMNALLIKDEQARVEAVIPLVHKSLLNASRTDLDPSVKAYSFRRASNAVRLYKIPVKITRVARGGDTTVGFGNTAEAGRRDRFFVAKREGVAGLPAPIHVFFPADGGEPKILNMGSL